MGTRPVILAVVTALLLGACSPVVRVHGYAPNRDELSLIEPGVDSIFSLEERIGRPATFGLVEERNWFYVQTTMEQLAYNPPRVTDRTVVAVSFDEDGIVEAVDSFGIEDGRVIRLNPRVTRTNARTVGILGQLFGNLANFDPAAILNQN